MNKLYSLKQFADRVNVSPSTLRRWDTSGRLKAKRRESGPRYYDESDVRCVLNITPMDGTIRSETTKDVVNDILAVKAAAKTLVKKNEFMG